MNILSAIYSGNRGIIKGLESHAKHSQEATTEPMAHAEQILDEAQVKSSMKTVRIADSLLRELTNISEKK